MGYRAFKIHGWHEGDRREEAALREVVLGLELPTAEEVDENDGDWGVARLTGADGAEVVLHHNCIYMLSAE